MRPQQLCSEKQAADNSSSHSRRIQRPQCMTTTPARTEELQQQQRLAAASQTNAAQQIHSIQTQIARTHAALRRPVNSKPQIPQPQHVRCRSKSRPCCSLHRSPVCRQPSPGRVGHQRQCSRQSCHPCTPSTSGRSSRLQSALVSGGSDGRGNSGQCGVGACSAE